MSRAARLWLAAWPLWLLLAFAAVWALHPLPAAWLRACLAAPVVLAVPGSLTIGAAAARRHRPGGAAFACYAVILSVIWLVAVSLALTAAGMPLTAASTYWSLLLVSAVLAAVAGLRLRAGRPARHPVPRPAPPADPGPGRTGGPNRPLTGALWCAAAVAAGAGLLAGGAYARVHLPHPAPAGYTWLAWAGPKVNGVIPVGRHGTALHFEITHRAPGTAAYRLRAVWQAAPPRARALAGPLTVHVGADQTLHGSLSIPPLPDGCTHRLLLTLTAAGQPGPRAGKPRAWSINADVRDRARRPEGCRP